MSATDRYSHQLLYATVRQRLLDDIAQGVYLAGQQIPTENELCTQYNVSRITIRKAISDLVADGRTDPLAGKRHLCTKPES
ncbi:DNA-binding transcriptional regulator FrlR [Escherichia coli]|nr:DNA-binding transcriptional regulator FrlR [Escherichia coli]